MVEFLQNVPWDVWTVMAVSVVIIFVLAIIAGMFLEK